MIYLYRSLEQKTIRDNLKVLIITTYDYNDRKIKNLHVSVKNDGEGIKKILLDNLYCGLLEENVLLVQVF